MNFYDTETVIAVFEQSGGNTTVGNMWLETQIFNKSNTIEDVLMWAKSFGIGGGKLIITIPKT